MVLAVSTPVKLLHEAVGHVITLELKSGELYRGHLMTTEDNMNCLMEGVKVTSRDGKLSQLDQVFLKGSQIRFFVVPDQLRHAPFFKAFENKRQVNRGGRGGARGGATR
jgi:small nuclear ribonucleoprotein D3